MTARIGFDDDRMQRMEQATLWLQRMQAADQEDRVVEAWLDWCQQDPLNQQAFDEIAAIWEMSGQLAASKPSQGVNMQRRRLVASLAGFGLAAAVGGTWWLTRPARDVQLQSEFTTPIGVNRTEKLADGSVLELGGGTHVTVTISAHARRVELHEGELFVTVHHEPARPFTVDTGKLEVIATGTAFNVLLTAERTTVTVAEGSVAAFHEGQAAEGPNVSVQSGQQIVYSHVTHSMEMRQTDPRNAIAWRNGTLFFQNEPLSEVIATINRYAPQRIVIEDAAVGALAFMGTARTDHIDGWLAALPHVSPVAVTVLADGRLQIDAAPRARTD